MKPKKNILFTFDYELFLGQRSGSVQKCMLEPTEKLISIFDSYKINQAIFFVDTTYLLRLKDAAKHSVAAKNDFDAIVNQLQQLIQKNHSVFPHIHPHWLDALYDSTTNSWILSDISKYRFHAISETQRAELFEASIAFLNEIILPLNPTYKLDGYRAGGWCIQPFTDFYPHFKQHNIQFDFSVLPGLKNLSNAQYYDFEQAPSKPIYRFEDIVLQENSSGSFTEFAISVIDIPLLTQFASKLLLKYLWKTGNRSIGDGSGVVAARADGNAGKKKSGNEMISLELVYLTNLMLYKNFLKQTDFMHFISHPKMLSTHNFKCFEKFLTYASNHYEIESDFRKMTASINF